MALNEKDIMNKIDNMPIEELQRIIIHALEDSSINYEICADGKGYIKFGNGLIISDEGINYEGKRID